MDKLSELLDKLEFLLLALVPALYAIGFRVYNKIKETKLKEKALSKKKAKDTYDVWEHEESRSVIREIKNFCNFYKDKGHCDLVQYLQLENGTMATSKIQNMFLTCLAEDDRDGCIPKFIKKLQRIPYSETVCWLEKLLNTTSTDDIFLCTPDISKADYNRTRIEDITGIGSVIVAPVYSRTEILLGICVFYYHEINYNGRFKTEHDLMDRFKNSVESKILEYHIHRDKKKADLGLEDE